MPALIEAQDLTKKYGKHVALDHANFTVEAGRIVGLIGPNGAGKTSALRAILGLTAYEGRLNVLGREPFRERAELMRDACFIADVAVLPAWLRVDQAIDFVAGVHPRFRRDRALSLLAKAEITGERRMLGKVVLYYEQPNLEQLAAWGEVHTLSIADLFVAKLSGDAA